MATPICAKKYYLNAPLSKLRILVGIQPFESSEISGGLVKLQWQQRIENPMIQFRNNAPLLAHDFSQLNDRIFTKCEDVEPVDQNEAESHHLRHRKPRKAHQLVVDQPTKEQHEHSRKIDAYMSEMQILVYLGAFDRDGDPSNDENDVYRLCTIKAFGTSCIEFDPDYADRNVGIETRFGRYRITLKVDEYKEFSSIDEEKKPLKDEPEEFFDVSDSESVQLTYLVEIEKGINFPRSQYYIEYKLDLPTHMTTLDTSLLTGRSQICYVKEDEEGDEVAHFGFPIQFDLIAKDFAAPNRALLWPRLLIRVCAEDYWGRHYVDGYGSYSLPVETRIQTTKIPTWRPVNAGVTTSALKELFVGQAVDLTAIELISPSSSENNIQSRLGITTETSGYVEIKSQCVMHSKRFVSESMMKHLRYGKIMSKIGMNANLHWRIMKVLMEFENAKRELLKLGFQKNEA
ncbi:hypothetical protein L596_017021 [Steinernema carpocapsae]|uniref:Meckel syndrome type 1 protein n=1 Tax=Steinernema carpocapsae TaxID=34508 RepID=A0A4U5N0J6_STECR|nr:hypothetical protein L596_017021 [Steinernema carpocapsae]